MERTAEWNPKIYKPQLSWPFISPYDTSTLVHASEGSFPFQPNENM